jgi:hypothetical protein
LQGKAWLKIPNKEIKKKQSTVRLCPRDETIMQQPNPFSSSFFYLIIIWNKGIYIILQTEKWIQYHRCNILSMPLANHSIPPQNNIFLSIFFSLSFTFFTFNPFYILFFIVADFKYLSFFLFYDREWSQQGWSRGGKRPHCWWLWHFNFIYSLPFGVYWFLAFIVCCSYFVITTFKYEKRPWMIFKLQSACVIRTTLEKSF